MSLLEPSPLIPGATDRGNDLRVEHGKQRSIDAWMWPLDGRVQHYAWGSHTALARLQGRPYPTEAPEAELWFGAHETAPSAVHGPAGPQALDAAIARAPQRLLGEVTAARFGGRMPFLLKVLAAARPLSLQVHPDLPQAIHGYALEERAAIPRDAPQRCFRDAWPKPELLRACTPFAALCGFRDPARTRALLEVLELPGTAWIDRELAEGRRSALPGITEGLLRLPATERRQLLASLRAVTDSELSRPHAWAATRRWLRRLATNDPDDPGVLVALLLELIELAPGEALSVPPGTPHAYLEGVGVEILAASDNVLRGGMTGKHVDVARFVGLLDATGHAGPPRAGRVPRRTVHPGHHRYLGATPYFQLDECTADAEVHRLERTGATIVLCLDGDLRLTEQNRELGLQPGQAAFLAGGGPPVTLRCTGTAMVAGPGPQRR